MMMLVCLLLRIVEVEEVCVAGTLLVVEEAEEIAWNHLVLLEEGGGKRSRS